MKSSNTEGHPFTKGPWKVDSTGVTTFIDAYDGDECLGVVAELDPDDSSVCFLHKKYGEGDREAHIANAKLIAAAPEMLQALKSALGAIYELDELTGWSRQELRDQYKNAVSVIDRATGKHQEGNAK